MTWEPFISYRDAAAMPPTTLISALVLRRYEHPEAICDHKAELDASHSYNEQPAGADEIRK
jgi:hypothetical protein